MSKRVKKDISVATSERWTDKQSGERREKTEWHTVVIFNEGLAKVAEQYLRKGSNVYVEGQIQTRKWTDKSGADRYSTEIVLQRFRGKIDLLGDAGGKQEAGRDERASQPAEGRRAADAFDDDIPFAPEVRG